MMRRFDMRLLASAGLLVALGGCMGSDNDGAPAVVTFEDQALSATKAFAALDVVPNTAFMGMPTSGTATYVGEAALGMSTTGANYALLGTTSVTADFQNSTLSGSLSGFHGGAIAAGELFPTANDDYAGTIALTGGKIGVARPNDFAVDFAGTLSGAGNTVVVGGSMTGNFNGTPIKGITSDTLSGTTGSVNGVAATDVILDIYAK